MDDQNFVFAVTSQTFQAQVIDRSQQLPVIVLFWAEQAAPAAEARSTLERLVGQYQGKVVLALVDVAEDQGLAQQLRVTGLPSIRVVKDGQLIEQLEGPQAEATLTALLDQLTRSSGDLLRDQLAELLAAEDFSRALEILQQAIKEEPHNQTFRVELADVLVQQGELIDARQVLAAIPEETPDRQRPEYRLAIAEEAAELPDAKTLAIAYEAEPDNLELCYQLAIVLAHAGEFQTALDHAMSILQRDREFMDDVGRTTMIRIFAILGKGSELTGQYRRRMFNFMH
ncbi:MAG: tetratricopeptide repeat protein [Pseudomonadales bacterium]